MAAPEQTAPTLVQIRHTLWHLIGDVDDIAAALHQGQVVEFICGQSWCMLAAGGAARQIQTALWQDHQLRVQFTTDYRSDVKLWFITFTTDLMEEIS